MVEVFKTNVSNTKQADEIISLLLHALPGGSVNIDLDDCDKVLRIEHEKIQAAGIINLLHEKGLQCSILL